VLDTQEWTGDRSAPLKDFIDAVARRKAGLSWTLNSPGSSALGVLSVIDAAYRSARAGGRPISVAEKTGIELAHVAIQTSELGKSLQFYCDIIGGTLIERRPFKKRELAWVDIDGIQLEIYSKRHDEQLEDWSDRYSGPVHIAFRVSDLSEFLENAIRKGARFHPSHPAPFAPIAGARTIAYLLGPDGEEVEVRDDWP
jgi:catechol 2,3-dioxygenase-like lactoylglutathione lyase family enzyme